MTARSIGVGVIGQGFIGRAHSHALRQVDLLELPAALRPVILCGRNIARASRNAGRWGFAQATSDWQEVVTHPEVDLVCVLTPNNLHEPITLGAIEAGKHVLCEKPLGRTLSESRAMLQAAERSDLTTGCSFNYRYMPAVQLCRDIIGGGELGSISHFRAQYLQDWGWDACYDWHHDQDQAGTGAIGDYSHIIDLAHYLVGDIFQVGAETLTTLQQRPDRDGQVHRVTVEDAYACTGRFRSGALLSLEASRVASGRKAMHRFEINGERGSLWWDMEDLNHLWWYRAADGSRAGFRKILVTEPDHPFISGWWPSGHTLGWEHCLVHQWAGFVERLEGEGSRSSPQATFIDGWRADVVVDAISRSAKTQTPVRVSYERQISDEE